MKTHAASKHIPERKRAKFKGRGKEHSYLRLYHFLLDSPEFASLSGSAVKLLLEAAKEFKGYNNGNINLAWSRLSERGWVSQGTAHRAKRELLSKGFLVCTRHGGKNRCSLYAISWEAMDACDSAHLEIGPTTTASHEWRKACSDKSTNLLSKSEQSEFEPQPEFDD